MVVRIAMRRAFVGASPTGDDAGVKLRVDEIVGCFGLPHQHPRRGGADVRAVQVGPDAAAKATNVLRLGEAGVGARVASVGARAQRGQGLRIEFDPLDVVPWVAAQHQFGCLHALK